jgi:hypothetical protein
MFHSQPYFPQREKRLATKKIAQTKGVWAALQIDTLTESETPFLNQPVV